MARYEYQPDHPWDDGVYGTGRTQPPKNHGGLIAFLLILVIFLSGIVTMLGIMNIRLFRQLKQKPEAEPSITFDAEPIELIPETTAPADGSLRKNAPEEEIHLDLQAVPGLEEAAEEEAEALPDSLSLQDIYTKCIPSVVSITTSLRGGSASGTGVILSSQGYIATNYHVIENATQITVQLTDDRLYSAGLVGSDPATDLAVLFIEADDLEAAEFGSSDNLRVGDSVVAIGDPLGVKYRGSMTNGIVSAINRNVTVNGRTMNLIQTNAALNSGNSGGPLINSYGQVIGINTVKIGAFTDSAGVEGIGFAIPSDTVKDIVTQIVSQGYVSGRPWLGITGESISLFYQRYYRLPAGLYITDVAEGSNAQQIGITTGDILLSIDDTRIYSQEELDTLLYNYSAGDTVTIVIYRSGHSMQAEITLEEAHPSPVG